LYKTSKRFVNRVAELALSKKAEDVVSMDLRGLTTTCDFFVICGATSDVHARAIADGVVQGMKEVGERPWHVEGHEASKWVLIDYVDVVVHVFNRETRDYYQLERLWGDAKFEEYKDEE
jgi:ribosome-associated protein